MRIGHFCSNFGRSSDGASRCAYEVARHHRLAGHDVLLYSWNKDCTTNDLDELALVNLGDASSSRQVSQTRTSLNTQLVSLDVLHLHAGVYCLKTFRVARRAKRLGLPYVYSPQGALNVLATGDDDLKRWVFRTCFTNRLINDAAWVQAHSHSEADFLRGLGVRAEIKIFPNGVSPITDSFVEHPINLNNVRLGYIGRIDVYKKGLDRLVEALARTTHELGSVVHLTMAGPDWYGQLESLLKKCAALDVRRYIEYVGEVARDKLASFFSSVDLLLIPSRYEGFPLVFGEACQYGCPVVVTPGSNVADYVRDNQVGFVVDDLAAELPRIVAGLTPESHEKLREHALTLGRRLSWETISRDICRAYPSRAMR